MLENLKSLVFHINQIKLTNFVVGFSLIFLFSCNNQSITNVEERERIDSIKPEISGISPLAGLVDGGFTVTISGSNFSETDEVTINGVSCTSLQFVSSSRITCIVPAQSAGTYNVKIEDTSGSGSSLLLGFTYFEEAPTITSLDVTAGALAGGTAVSITGTGFLDGATVSLGGSSCTAATVVSDTNITCTTSAHSAGTVNVAVVNGDNQVAIKEDAYTYQAAPAITSLDVTAGALAGGTAISITGTGFLTGAAVDFGGSSCGSVTVVSSTNITCTTTAHAAGAVTVTVTNSDTQSGDLATAYTYQAAPTVSSLDITSGYSLGGTAITITGTDFLAGATVLIGTVACGSVDVVSSTSITCTTAASTGGVVAVTVTNPDSQSDSLASGYTYVDAPTVTSLSRSGGPLAGGTSVTITGTGFLTGATVDFGSSACTSVVFNSLTSITCDAPAGTGTVAVKVTNPDSQTGTLASAYTYQAGPIVSLLDVIVGALSGGDVITITGTGFLTGATVVFDASGTAAACADVELVSATQIKCTTTAHVAGAVDVTVTNPDTQADTLTSAFTYQAGPTLTSISVASGPSIGGTAVTLTGADFTAGATVLFGTYSCTGVTFVSATTITCTTGAATVAGAVDVKVTHTDNQTSTLSSAFTYIDAPVITSLDVTAGALAGGTDIVITGTGFHTLAGDGVTVLSTVNTVMFDTSSCTIADPATDVTATTITCTTTAHAAGSVNVIVTNTDTQTVTATNAYTYQAAPTVTSLDVTAGALAGGTAVSITGTGFLSGAAVDFGGSACGTVVVVSATNITCTTTAHAAGTVTVTVTNADTQSGNLASAYTYQEAPSITSLDVTAGALGGGTAISITGTGFLSGATVDFGTFACGTVVVVSDTNITCVTSAGTGTVDVKVTNTDTQTVTKTSAYTYQAAPTVTSLDVVAYTVDVGPLAGGTNVSITGTGFLTGATVDFGGSACGSVVVVSDTNITCTTTAHAAGAVTVTVTNADSQSGNLPTAYTYQAAPTITSISPGSGAEAGGTPVTITGTGFLTGAVVEFDNAQCTGLTVVSSTSITCTTPAHAAGTVTVKVTNTDNQYGSQPVAFIYIAAPTVTSLDVTAGALAGGTAVSITGTGFLSGAAVDFGGSACTSVVVVSATNITCVTPAGTGAVTVTVTNADTQAGSLASAYTYQAAPTVSLLDVTAGALGGGTDVSITGTGFVSGASVDFGGSACGSVNVVSATNITCTTSSHAAGAVTVTVTNADTQSGNLAAAYTYQAAPTITSLDITSGALAGGTAVSITGTGFLTGATVDFGGSSCGTVVVVSATNITCVTSAGTGTVTVTVTNTDTQAGSLASAYTYQAAPTVTSLDVTAGPLAGGTAVSITGTGFLTGATVDFGGSACGSITVVSSTNITCTTIAHAAGAVTVSVTNSDSQSGNLASAYTYQAAPTVTSLDVTTGPITGATAVSITGTGFVSGATVDFGGSACGTIVVVSVTNITCITSAHASGAVTVTITNADSQSGNLPSAFTYVDPPTVTSLDVTTGAIAGGTAVSITGTGFLAGASVDFDGSACGTVVVASDTNITCSTTAHAAGAVTVTVTNLDSQSGTLASAFTYIDPPTVTAISPASGTVNGGTEVTLTGTGFLTGATVAIGGTTCTSPNVVSSTSITCITGVRASGTVDVVVTDTYAQTGTLSSGFTYQSTAELAWKVGTVSPEPPNPADYGSTSVNVTYTFTLKNLGDVSTSTISITTSGTTPAGWLFGTDNCSGTTLASGAECTVQVIFLGGLLTSGSYDAVLNGIATSGGTTTNDLLGVVP